MHQYERCEGTGSEQVHLIMIDCTMRTTECFSPCSTCHRDVRKFDADAHECMDADGGLVSLVDVVAPYWLTQSCFFRSFRMP